MESSFNVLSLESYIRGYMREHIKASYPNMDTSDNSVFDDIFVKPMIGIIKPLFDRISNIELKSNLKYASVLTDAEIEDIGLNNYSVIRTKGSSSTVQQTFGFSRLEDKGITVPAGVVVTDNAGISFTTTQSVYYSKEEGKLLYNPSTQTYDVVTSMKATGKGSAYNVGANTLTICQTKFSEYLSYTTNAVAATGGQDNEDIQNYINRAIRYYVSQHLGTEPGYVSALTESFPNLSGIRLIGYRDEGMERDTIEVVVTDADGNPVFDPGEGALSDRFYARTAEKHIGGCVDIYVRGSEYAVEEHSAPVQSNILEIDGGVDVDSIKVTNISSVSRAAVPFSVAMLSDSDAQAAADSKYAATFDSFKASVDDVFDENYGVIEDKEGGIDIVSDEKPAVMYIPMSDSSQCTGLSNATQNLGQVRYSLGNNVKYVSLVFYTNSDSLSEDVLTIDSAASTIKFNSEVVGQDENGNNVYRLSSGIIPKPGNTIDILFNNAIVQNGSGQNALSTSYEVLHSVSLYEKFDGNDEATSSLKSEFAASVLTQDPLYAVTGDVTLKQSFLDSPVLWTTDRADIVTNLELGTVMPSRDDADVKISGEISYNSGANKVFTVILYQIRVKSDADNTWSVVTDPKFATKTLIFVEQEFDKSSVLEVEYSVPADADGDTDQAVIEQYTVGYDELEVPAPVTSDVVSAYYKNVDTWSQTDYLDWAKQMKAAFHIDLAVADEPKDEEYQDFSNEFRVVKYSTELDRELVLNDDSFEHKYDRYYIGSSQERAFLIPTAKSAGGYLYALPNSKKEDAALLIRVPYNKTLNSARNLLYGQDSRIVTADVLIREADRTPVNVGVAIKVKNGAEISSLNRAQIYTAIESLFRDAEIGGRVEQSDIVGKLYTDATTTSFVEYVRLPLSAFYIPDSIEDEVEDGNVAGDYIQAGVHSCLYLNKVIVSLISE